MFLHNIFIINNDSMRDDWIDEVDEAKEELRKKIIKGKIDDGRKSSGQKIRIVEVKRQTMAVEDVPILNKVNDGKLKKITQRK